MNKLHFDPQAAWIGIAIVSPIVTIAAGVAMNDIVATGVLIWCIAMSAITAMRREP